MGDPLHRELIASDWQMYGAAETPSRAVEAPHVCPEDGYCPYYECPNQTPGYHLVREVADDSPRGYHLVEFERHSVAQAHVDERGWCTWVVWYAWERCG